MNITTIIAISLTIIYCLENCAQRFGLAPKESFGPPAFSNPDSYWDGGDARLRKGFGGQAWPNEFNTLSDLMQPRLAASHFVMRRSMGKPLSN
jgi:hypothetical protein